MTWHLIDEIASNKADILHLKDEDVRDWNYHDWPFNCEVRSVGTDLFVASDPAKPRCFYPVIFSDGKIEVKLEGGSTRQALWERKKE